ncbi:hypothetical protein [Endozoicomonas acroporae]|uniref:hypothetical protein n=1 Tax=Endozoicomonas acroporae TaxID=1701104 RepID=UPI0013D2E8A2|nr:hypothetical protein [Endozoicomonas acroporae]
MNLPLPVDSDQGLMFPQTVGELCDLIGLNWLAAEQLAAEGLLSFEPEWDNELSTSEEAELTFVGKLVVAGCDLSMVKRLVRSLKPPFAYSHQNLYFDWLQGAWRSKPFNEPVEFVAELIEQLLASDDIETLYELKASIDSALAEAGSDEEPQ